MKLVFTYDSFELKEIRQVFSEIPSENHIHVLTTKNDELRDLYDVAIEIKERVGGQDSIIFINQFLSCADEGFEWLQSNSGIALVKFLRMIDVRSHIVLITPFTDIQLVNLNPANIIVTSRGISCVKYLHEFTGKSIKDLAPFASDILDEGQDLKPFILIDFRLPEDERHNWANWWGIVQLIDSHNSLFPDERLLFVNEKGEEIPYPHSVYKRLKELQSQKAIFLYQHSPSEFVQATNELVVKETESRLKMIDAEISIISSQLKPSGRDVYRPKQSNFVDLRNYYHQLWKDSLRVDDEAAGRLKLMEQEQESLINSKTIECNSLLQQKDQLQKQLPVLAKGSSRTIESDIENGILSELKKIRASFSANPPKILYVDDQASDGWSEVFQAVLYGEKSNFFEALQSDFSNLDRVIGDVESRIYELQPDVIMLDLRLQKEVGTFTKVITLSGAKVLQHIRHVFPGLTVMMTTASNKAWTYEHIKRLGADAFWIKEGIDNHNKPEETILNYSNLVQFVSRLKDKRYKALEAFADFVKNIDYIKGSFISAQKRWGLSNGTIVSTSGELEKLLKQIVDNIRVYLHEVHMKYREGKECLAVSDAYYSSNIINKLGNVVEIIHDVREEDFEIGVTVWQMINSRADYKGNEIRSLRNKASHRNYIESSWDVMETLLNKVTSYLTTLH